MEKLYHIGLDASHGAKYAILPGDPGRVPKIAKYLEEPRFLAQNREFTTWIGSLSGEKVLVTSTGIGGPSAAICAEELYKTGVTTFVRIGTCGGMKLDVCGGDIVIANAAIRAEGVTREYIPIEFPAVSDFEVTRALIETAKASGEKYHVGVVQCKDSFYGQHDPARMPAGETLLSKWDAWLKAGTLASEMESAALFIVAQTLGARAGCVLHTVWNKDRAARGMTDVTSEDTDNAVRVAVGAVKRLVEAGR